MWSNLLLIVLGISFGLLSSAGVFTVLTSVGLIPRFIQATRTFRYLLIYEEMVVAGTIIGGIYSLNYPSLPNIPQILSLLFLGCYGLFAGCFVGCLALAVSEMLNAVPIFARRMQFHDNLRPVIFAVAFGKLVGSLVYFLCDLDKLSP